MIYYGILWYTVVYCDVLWYTVIYWCSMLQYNVVYCVSTWQCGDTQIYGKCTHLFSGTVPCESNSYASYTRCDSMMSFLPFLQQIIDSKGWLDQTVYIVGSLRVWFKLEPPRLPSFLSGLCWLLSMQIWREETRELSGGRRVDTWGRGQYPTIAISTLTSPEFMKQRAVLMFHAILGIPRLPAQSRDSENAQRNFEIVQISRLCGTLTLP